MMALKTAFLTSVTMCIFLADSSIWVDCRDSCLKSLGRCHCWSEGSCEASSFHQVGTSASLLSINYCVVTLTGYINSELYSLESLLSHVCICSILLTYKVTLPLLFLMSCSSKSKNFNFLSLLTLDASCSPDSLAVSLASAM